MPVTILLGALSHGSTEIQAKMAPRTPPDEMRTEVVHVNPEQLQADAIGRAAQVLRRGGLVAFPTETVYGLGANALAPEAVARIFAAKGRPANNPLIVHVTTVAQAKQLVAAWPEGAERLARAFWPGPLTLVLLKGSIVPDIVTAGGPTVAIRLPAHAIAHALLEAAQVPVAAPSANRSTCLSPTRAEHVLRSLDGRIDMLLDGGPTAGGLESTVLDLTTTPARLLRPGLIPVASLEAVIGKLIVFGSAGVDESMPLPSPGMMARHYAPRASLECSLDDGWTRVEPLCRAGHRVGWLRLTRAKHESIRGLDVVTMPARVEEYSQFLYEVLHELDDVGVDRIVVEMPPDEPAWLAVRDRLQRAARHG